MDEPADRHTEGAVVLDRAVANSLQVARVFEDNKQRINAIDFAPTGEYLVTSSHDDSINIYDCLEGRHRQRVMSQKYGCCLARFTHAENTIIHASKKGNDDIRYLSLHDNSYLQYFSGHKKTVTSLSMSPLSDAFISASEDATIRLWDLRTKNCQGVLNTASVPPVAAFDNDGIVFAAGLNSDTIKLYDVRKFEKGPFLNFHTLQNRQDGTWTDLTFSPDGSRIAVSTTAGITHLIDAYKGYLQATIGSSEHNSGEALMTSFSPCGQHIVRGSRSGALHIWDVESGTEEAQLHAHNDTATCVRFNPKYLMLASADKALALWLPKMPEA